MEKYTTAEIKKKILENKEISQEDKDLETDKIVLSEDAFAVCEFLEDLTTQLRLTRLNR